MQERKFLKKASQREKQRCTCAQLSSVFLLFCPEGNLFPPISISHAIQARAASLLFAECMKYLFVPQAMWGKLHGSVTGVWEFVWALQITIGAY